MQRKPSGASFSFCACFPFIYKNGTRSQKSTQLRRKGLEDKAGENQKKMQPIVRSAESALKGTKIEGQKGRISIIQLQIYQPEPCCTTVHIQK